MSAATLQIAIMVAVLGFLVWLAVRPSRPRGARRPSGDHPWSGDAAYNIADAGEHYGSSGHDAGSGHSGSSGDGGDGDGGAGSSD